MNTMMVIFLIILVLLAAVLTYFTTPPSKEALFIPIDRNEPSEDTGNLKQKIEDLECRISEIKDFHSIELSNKDKSFKLKEKEIRADAIKRHKSTTKGKQTEHLIPYAEEFNYNPSDCRFMGSPIDMLVFDGLSDNDNEVSVVFLEIKTGSSSLSSRERKVRDAIKAGRVKWRLIRKTQ